MVGLVDPAAPDDPAAEQADAITLRVVAGLDVAQVAASMASALAPSASSLIEGCISWPRDSVPTSPSGED